MLLWPQIFLELPFEKWFVFRCRIHLVFDLCSFWPPHLFLCLKLVRNASNSWLTNHCTTAISVIWHLTKHRPHSHFWIINRYFFNNFVCSRFRFTLNTSHYSWWFCAKNPPEFRPFVRRLLYDGIRTIKRPWNIDGGALPIQFELASAIGS